MAAAALLAASLALDVPAALAAGDGQGGGGGSGAGSGLALVQVDYNAASTPDGLSPAPAGLATNSLQGQVSPDGDQPTGLPYVVLTFDKNVSYAQGDDDSFVQANASRVHLRYADGTDVEGVTVDPLPSFDARRQMGIRVEGWLRPLTEYQVVVDAGVMAANGVDALEQPEVRTFRTNADCADGVSVYAKLAIGVVVLALVGGMAAAVVRRRRA